MSKNPLKIKAAYLYPDYLRSFCDKANLDVFKYRASERNINVEIEEIKNGDKINSSRYDFYYIAGSNIEVLEICSKNLKNNYTQFHVAVESNIPMLAINCGYILFGKTFQLDNSPPYTSLGIFDAATRTAENQIYSKVVGRCNFLKKNNDIAGFTHRYTDTVLENGTEPFLILRNGKTEGARYKNVIGTYITSPILAQNPYFCDYLIANCLQTRYKCSIPLAKLTDDIEWYSHNYLLEAK